MTKLLVISPTAAGAASKLETYGLTIHDAKIVRRYEDICGYKDMLMLYGGEAWSLPDFDKIIDYCTSHGIKCIKTDSGHDFEERSTHDAAYKPPTDNQDTGELDKVLKELMLSCIDDSSVTESNLTHFTNYHMDFVDARAAILD